MKRILSFLRRLHWFSSLAGGPLAALWLLVRIRRFRQALHEVRFDGRLVRFRAADEQALREVLVDLEYAYLASALREVPRPRVLDVGAHIGTFAIWTLSVAPQAQILSVEADPVTLEVIRLNADGAQGWTVLHAAAGAGDGDILRLSDAGPSMSHRIDSSGNVEVPSLSLPSLLERLAPGGGRIDLAKVDIEGSEEQFLCAHPEALERIDSMVIELHPSLCDATRVEALLRASFAEVAPIGGRASSKPLLYCRR